MSKLLAVSAISYFIFTIVFTFRFITGMYKLINFIVQCNPLVRPEFFGRDWVYLVRLFIPLTFMVLLILLTYFLHKRKNRTVCIVLALVSCINYPVGLILGIFTIILLTRPAIKEQFVANQAVLVPR